MDFSFEDYGDGGRAEELRNMRAQKWEEEKKGKEILDEKVRKYA